MSTIEEDHKSRHCIDWDKRPGVEPAPFQDEVIPNCGNCRYYNLQAGKCEKD